MILKVKGSHHFFRNVCQIARQMGDEVISKVDSPETAEKEVQEILSHMIDALGFEMGFEMEGMPSLVDFDLFPECDEEADQFELYAADLDDVGFPEEEIDELVLQSKLFSALEILSNQILLRMFYTKLLPEAA